MNFISRNRKMYHILYLNVERSKLNLRTYRVWCVVIFVYEVSATGSVCVGMGVAGTFNTEHTSYRARSMEDGRQN